MRRIIGRSWLMVVLCTIAISSQAQSIYSQESALIREQVWKWEKPEFAVRTIPAEFNKMSRVIIARHTDISAGSTQKSKYWGSSVYQAAKHTEIFREAVKINDKSAVADYSEFSFNQFENKSRGYISKTTTVYIGVRVIKPNGDIKEINADDIVLTKDEKKEKQAKLAVADLQVGDIIDYFIAKETYLSQISSMAPYTFALFDEYPILSYSVHCVAGKKNTVSYRSYNGAPELDLSYGDDGSNIFDIKKENIPAYTESGLWVSPYRQLPIIRLSIQSGTTYAEVNKDPDINGFITKEKNFLASLKSSNSKSLKKDYSRVADILEDYFKKLKKNKNDLSQDSIAAELFYIYRFSNFLDFNKDESIDEILERNEQDLSSSFYTYNFGEFLKLGDVDNQLVLVTPADGPVLNQILSIQDIEYLVQLQSRNKKIFGFDNIYTTPFFIPSAYENTRQAITINTKSRSTTYALDFDQGTTDVPGTSAADNARIEKMNLLLSPDGSALQVNRTTTLKGHYKSDMQKKLILVEDYCNAERKAFGVPTTIVEDLQDGRRSKKFADELQAAFNKARSKQKDAFIEEAKDWFRLGVSDLTDYKVENMGVRHTSPDLVYSSKFKMEDVVKKAGNNLIIEIGKLEGPTLNITPIQFSRTMDIYMPFARSFDEQIVLQVPAGYTVEGVNELNKKIENSSGHFITEAAFDGNTLTIRIRRSYNHAFEIIGNWDKLIEFIQASKEWSNSKILLKKK